MSRTVILHPSEDIMSFLSRLAAANGSPSMKSFARQLGISHQSLVHGVPQKVEKLAKQLHPYSVAEITNACFYRPEPSHPGEIRGHRFKSVFRNKTMRYCAACLVEDLKKESGDERFRPYRRLSWLIPDIVSCHKHQVALSEPLVRPPKGNENEFYNIVWTNMETIVRQSELGERLEMTEYEKYRARRFEGVIESDEWIDQMPSDVILNVSRHLGVFALYPPNKGPQKHELAALSAARQKGFELLCLGEAPLRETIRARARHLWFGDTGSAYPSTRTPASLFGSLFRMLSNEDGDGYGCMKSMVREIGLELLPLGPRDQFLGPVTERRFHTISSLASEFGIQERRIHNLLKEEGILGRGVPVSRIPIGELPLQKLREESRRMGFQKFVHQYGLTDFTNTIIFDGTWPHSIREIGSPSVIYKTYTSTEADTLLSLLTAKANPPSKDPVKKSRFTSIKRASQITGVSINCIIKLLAAGRLSEVAFYGGSRFDGIHVCVEELKIKHSQKLM